MRLVTLYERPGCHLCEDALTVILRVRSRTPFELERRDIEQDEDLHRRMLERIPVVCLDGVEVFQFFVDEAALDRLLAGGVDDQSPL